MKPQPRLEILKRPGRSSKLREDAEFDCAQHGYGCAKPKAQLQDTIRCQRAQSTFLKFVAAMCNGMSLWRENRVGHGGSQSDGHARRRFYVSTIQEFLTVTSSSITSATLFLLRSAATGR